MIYLSISFQAKFSINFISNSWYYKKNCNSVQTKNEKYYELGNRRVILRRELVKNCNQRHNFFCNQIVNDWNDLSYSIITAKSTKDFKSKLDKQQLFIREGIWKN
ncbi:hypothetical protein BpHYR1_052655 [Brachionus plicatilis]|uniref:RNA-directed DNA polymerase from mobile element jockey-like n=1 Tax=Brachionus plicatilis TaxID=10195 RepID=A0A3M7QG52_BRAPC|nr:hypothetical protein BpHYR1_052655 [Brachionus plicatilis]